MPEELKKRDCVPCEKKAGKLDLAKIKPLKDAIDEAWALEGDYKISRQFAFLTFKHAISFVNEIADIAEFEGHHPDFHIHYNKLTLDLWTHSVNGLTENDFIMAAKIDEIFGESVM